MNDNVVELFQNKAQKRLNLSLNLDNPQTVQEKIIWLAINEDPHVMDLKTKCADKILVHEYCKQKLGKDICVPILKIYDDPKDIDFNELPDKFVLKCNHGYAMNIIVDKSRDSFVTLKHINLNSEDDCKNQLNDWLNLNFGQKNGQTHYANIHPRCYAEQFLKDNGHTLTDYKVWCCNGEPRMIQVISDRYTNNLHANIYDPHWNWFDLGWNDFKQDPIHLDPKPKVLDQMLEYAEKLSKDFRFVRVDFYIIDEKLYLGELTFTPDGGIFKYRDKLTDLYWGNQIDLKTTFPSPTDGISVCVTAYKSQDYIKNCLDSIYKQTWFEKNNNFEVILGIDGCQETLDKVKSIMNLYPNLKVLMMNSNTGTYITSNTIMHEAKYDHIMRFDSDDVLMPQAIEKISKYWNDHDIVRFYHQNFGDDESEIKKGITIGCIVIKKNIFEKFGGYRDWICSGDSELWKRISKFTKTKDIREILHLRRIHGRNLTMDEKTDFRSEVRRKNLSFCRNMIINTEDDAIISMKTNGFQEIKTDFLPNDHIEDIVLVLQNRYPSLRNLELGLTDIARHRPAAIPTSYKIEGFEGPLYDARMKRENDKTLIPYIPKSKLIFTVNYDEHLPIVDEKPGYEYICFSDHEFDAEGWRVIVVDRLKTTTNKTWAALNIKYHPDEYLSKKYQQIMWVNQEIPDNYIYYFDKIFEYRLGIYEDILIYNHDYQNYLNQIWVRICSDVSKEIETISQICDEKVKIFT